MNDKTLSPIRDVSFEEYHTLVLSLISEKNEKLLKYVKKEWTNKVYDDVNRKDYPIRTTINEFIFRAKEIMKAENSEEVEAWVLPGCDVFANNEVRGWRPNLLIEGPEIRVVSCTVWGEKVPLWDDRDVADSSRRRVSLPLFRKVKVVIEKRSFQTRKHGERSGYTMLFLKEVLGKQPLRLSELKKLLLKAKNCYSLGELEEGDISKEVFSAIVLRDVRWRVAQGVDEWTESTTNFDNVEKRDSSGKGIMEMNPVTGRLTPVYDRVAKREKTPTGLPFVQPRINKEDEDPLSTEDVWTMNLSLSRVSEIEDDRIRPSVVFQNYKYAKPELFVPGKEVIFKNATAKGNIWDADRSHNPFAELNDCYGGLSLIVVANYSKCSVSKSRRQGSEETITKYLTFVPGLVMSESVDLFEGQAMKDYPPFPEDVPEEVINKLGQKLHPKVEKVEAEAEKDEDYALELEGLSREEELTLFKVKELRAKLVEFEDMGYEVELRTNKKSLVKQVLEIEGGKVAKGSEVMKEAKERIKETHSEDRVAKAKALLLAKKKKKEDVSGVDEAEVKQLEADLKMLMADFPEMSFDDLYGKDNDLEAFPEWVKPQHRDLIEALMKKIREQ